MGDIADSDTPICMYVFELICILIRLLGTCMIINWWFVVCVIVLK